MTQKPWIIYRARNDATPEMEASALANIYRLIVDSQGKRGRLLDTGGPDAMKGSKNDRAISGIHE
jgi:hypothetical protein